MGWKQGDLSPSDAIFRGNGGHLYCALGFGALYDEIPDRFIEAAL